MFGEGNGARGAVAGVAAPGAALAVGVFLGHGVDFQQDASLLPDVVYDLEKVLYFRVAAAAEHQSQTLYRLAGLLGQPGETRRGIDAMFQRVLSRFHLAFQQALYTFGQQQIPQIHPAAGADRNHTAVVHA